MKPIHFRGICKAKLKNFTADIIALGGGYLTKFNTEKLCPEVQPLTLLYTILAEEVPLLYTGTFY